MNGILGDGLTLMAVGMGTVLLFLCILIVSMHIMAAIVGWLNKIYPEPVAQAVSKKSVGKSSNDEEVAVAILAAMLKK